MSECKAWGRTEKTSRPEKGVSRSWGARYQSGKVSFSRWLNFAKKAGPILSGVTEEAAGWATMALPKKAVNPESFRGKKAQRGQAATKRN